VALHSLPLLENLADYFSKNYKFTREEIESEEKEQLRELMIKFNDKLDSVPTKGDFDINKVLESRYFFS
jgi:DNA-directed RNA polymerase